MKEIINIIGIYLLIVAVNFLLLIGALNLSNFSGGEVGMLPLAFLLSSAISIIISSIFILVIKIAKKFSYIRAIFIYFIISLAVDINFGLDPRNGKGFFENVDVLIITTICLTFIITITTYYFVRKSAKKNGCR